ncbi:subtype B tannase [Blautia sp. OF09-25XD]|uniref:subtype B tannase n=1 Tax=Blautia sp. OF09-25XD TaxID=2292981 RepID=UPI001FAB1946|nr:subtype B tannase [Blautia sp. OF09-25XD]
MVDYKAAVRYLHFFADELPGDASKIITNGTSAGGALSSLMGSTGNHPDYEPYLQALGAADAGDNVFAASCYCPITNLEHADMAYEWEFCGVNDFHRANMKMDEGGRPVFTPVDGEMTKEQILVSAEEKAMFPAYVNSLGLKDENGDPLTLDADGEGSLKEYVKRVVMESAQRASDQGVDLSDKPWLIVENGKVQGMDFTAYVKDITRMKTAPAFDALDLESPENDLFGNETTNCRHFTEYSTAHTKAQGACAEAEVVKMMNPMEYILDEKAEKAQHFRIRHGECDRDTSLVISAMLTAKLREAGCEVDYHSPWNTPHAGDYDLDELFAWIDGICG